MNLTGKYRQKYPVATQMSNDQTALKQVVLNQAINELFIAASRVDSHQGTELEKLGSELFQICEKYHSKLDKPLQLLLNEQKTSLLINAMLGDH